jgi:hypothetical protein
MSMTPKDKARDLVDAYRFILTQSETEAGEEILCTSIAIECALTNVTQMLLETCKNSEKKDPRYQEERIQYWFEVREEIKKL